MSTLNTLIAWKQAHPERVKAQGLRQHEKLRLDIFSHYGGKCVCCGFSDVTAKVKQGLRWRSMLEIDHTFGNGKEDRGIRMGSNLFRYLKRMGYPIGYRVLCRPCNSVMEAGEVICGYHKRVNILG